MQHFFFSNKSVAFGLVREGGMLANSMKLIFITREGYDQPGARIRSYGFAKQFQKRGVDTEVFSFVDHLGAKAGKNENNFTPIEKIKLTLRGLKYLFPKKNYIFVVNRFNYHTLPSWLSSLTRRNPCIFDMDDWEAREDVGYYFGLIPKSRAEYLTRIFSRYSKFCIASSYYLKDYLSQFNKKVYYLPTGIDLEMFKANSSSKNNDKVVFSWHGSINRREILDYLKFMLESFLVINRKYNFTELWIKGSGIFIEDLKNLLKKYNNYNNIKYIPWSSPQTIPSYLDNVDIGLFPVLEKTRFNLAKSPTKIFEYMAKKKPVIASKVGEAEHIIKHGHNGFLASDKDEFICWMEKLVEEPTLRDALGSNAYTLVKENYSLDILGEKLYNIFLENFR